MVEPAGSIVGLPSATLRRLERLGLVARFDGPESTAWRLTPAGVQASVAFLGHWAAQGATAPDIDDELDPQSDGRGGRI